MKPIERALEELWLRQTRRSHPDGKFDSGGRWYPSPEEERPCCGRIRPPSRRWPYSLLKHCRTVEHVARLYNIPVTELRRRWREYRKTREALEKLSGGER